MINYESIVYNPWSKLWQEIWEFWNSFWWKYAKALLWNTVQSVVKTMYADVMVSKLIPLDEYKAVSG